MYGYVVAKILNIVERRKSIECIDRLICKNMLKIKKDAKERLII